MSASCSLVISFRLLASNPPVTGPPSSFAILAFSIEEKLRVGMHNWVLLLLCIVCKDEGSRWFVSDIIVVDANKLDCVAASDGATALWTSLSELSCLPMRETDMISLDMI